ncbi:putative alpha-galactosidase d protein [Botrytis cinerea BcDW1]|uniref:Alpha-galactosidase n=1 Tax=Botryotinia fuckeliana (strain BcDW1) TaxID=1290391 RepID=M7U3J3_BOTF1|nr:putative alpha-galactosidase d protein [Botrytis cinerea BcDW1]
MRSINCCGRQWLLLSLFSQSITALPQNLNARINNGLAITPPMGWNSYNHYSCSPNETIIHSNAQALVSLGLSALGYHYVTVDCGWTLPDRTSAGTLTWNPDRFPSGFPALGTFIHGLGLGFGVYSDSGVQMCMTGTPAQVGSLYDNCYSDAATGYPNTNYAPSTSPSIRYQNMTNALATLSKPILFQICDWGVDFPSTWAPAMGNTWRITNDIIPSYPTVSRILNQAVPQTSFAGPGHWLDLDMLEVGNNIFTTAEEQTHFSLWAILKSPLVIGAALKDSLTSISSASLAILSNKDVISYNQDSLGVAASFRRRWTTDGYEVWAGPLSGGRTVVAVINLQNTAKTLTLNFPDVGLQKASSLKNIWANISTTNVLTSWSADVDAHGTMLLELGGTTAAGTYAASDATVSGSNITFSKIYAQTSSSNYTATLHFNTTSTSSTTFTIASKKYTLPAGSTSLAISSLSFTASSTNTLSIASSSTLLPSSLTITSPPATFYSSSSMSISGSATHVTCNTNYCTPSGTKIGYLTPSGSASITVNSPSTSTATSSTKYLSVYFCNNDIAFSTSWTTGTNTRNMTISVNGVVTRAEFPLSGKSSELFGTLGWQDTGIFGVLTSGWKAGSNVLTFSNAAGGLVDYAVDLVGVDVYW